MGLTGEVGMQLGWGWQVDAQSALDPSRLNAPGGGLLLFARLGQHFALGPEYSYAQQGEQVLISFPTGEAESFQSSRSLLSLRLRVGQAWGRVHPELVLGVGRYSFSNNHLGDPAGSSLAYLLTRALSLGA